MLKKYYFYWPVVLTEVFMEEYEKVADPIIGSVCRLLDWAYRKEFTEQDPKKLSEKLHISESVWNNVMDTLRSEELLKKSSHELTMKGKDLVKKLNEQHSSDYRRKISEKYYVYRDPLDNTFFGCFTKEKLADFLKSKNGELPVKGEEDGFLLTIKDPNKQQIDLDRKKQEIQRAYTEYKKKVVLPFEPGYKYEDPNIQNDIPKDKQGNRSYRFKIGKEQKGFIRCVLQRDNSNIEIQLPISVNAKKYIEKLRLWVNRENGVTMLNKSLTKQDIQDLFSSLHPIAYKKIAATPFEHWLVEEGFNGVWDIDEQALPQRPRKEAGVFNLRKIYDKLQGMDNEIFSEMNNSLEHMLAAYIAGTNQEQVIEDFWERVGQDGERLYDLLRAIKNKFKLYDNSVISGGMSSIRKAGYNYDIKRDNLYSVFIDEKYKPTIRAKIFYLIVDAFFQYGDSPFGSLLANEQATQWFKNVDQVYDARSKKSAHIGATQVVDVPVSEEERNKIFASYKAAVQLLLRFIPQKRRQTL